MKGTFRKLPIALVLAGLSILALVYGASPPEHATPKFIVAPRKQMFSALPEQYKSYATNDEYGCKGYETRLYSSPIPWRVK